MNTIEKEYKYPYLIFKKYFPKGNKEEFNRAFVTFDISEIEFKQLSEGKSNYVCWDTVMFDLNFIKSPLKECYKSINDIKNIFRK